MGLCKWLTSEKFARADLFKIALEIMWLPDYANDIGKV